MKDGLWANAHCNCQGKRRKFMSFLFLTVANITVHKAGEGGFWPFDTDAEWRVDISASSILFSYSTTFSNDSVSDGETFQIHETWVFLTNPGEKIRLTVS